MSQALILDQKLYSQVQTERKITHEILLMIQTMDILQSYRKLGYYSLFDYLVRRFGYSEGAANRRISAARLLRQVPEIAPQIQEGKLNLSQLAQAQTAINQQEKKTRKKISREKKKEALASLIGKNSFETKKSLIQDFENFIPPKPRVIPTKNKKVQVHLEFDESDWTKIQSLLSHMSHKVPDKKVESALLYWASEIEKKKLATQVKQETRLEKIEASRCQMQDIQDKNKAENKLIAKETVNSNEQRISPPLRRQSKTTRKSISSKVRHLLLRKANFQCQYISPMTGKKCDSHSFLDIDHITPLALGGTNEEKNLRILCRAHNHLLAKQMHLSSTF
jgi:5-methylcytosine-specific restriction endonuclease McrA